MNPTLDQAPENSQEASTAPRQQDKPLAKMATRQDLVRSLGFGKNRWAGEFRFPESGDEVFGFRLLCELGRGSFARVFLAEQLELGGRLVAVKVSKSEGTEPQTL